MIERAQPSAFTAPPRWQLVELRAAQLVEPVAMWVTASVEQRARESLPFAPLRIGENGGLPDPLGTLIVIGGGKLIDRAKLLRVAAARPPFLIACASIWGSGAEVSPIAVADDGDRKVVTMGPGVAPDVRVVWPELAATVPADAARRACGDVWAHAVEAMLSPLASDELVREAGDLVTRLLALPLRNDPRWFDLGAEACLLQARCSVGLVHGIAHVLERPLVQAHPELVSSAGHAGLCATFLWPVLRLLQSTAPTLAQRCEQAGVELERVLAVARELHDPQLYERALPELEQRWKSVLRDPCTRTSCTLIRPAHLDFFRERAFA